MREVLDRIGERGGRLIDGLILVSRAAITDVIVSDTLIVVVSIQFLHEKDSQRQQPSSNICRPNYRYKRWDPHCDKTMSYGKFFKFLKNSTKRNCGSLKKRPYLVTTTLIEPSPYNNLDSGF